MLSDISHACRASTALALSVCVATDHGRSSRLLVLFFRATEETAILTKTTTSRQQRETTSGRSTRLSIGNTRGNCHGAGAGAAEIKSLAFRRDDTSAARGLVEEDAYI